MAFPIGSVWHHSTTGQIRPTDGGFGYIQRNNDFFAGWDIWVSNSTSRVYIRTTSPGAGYTKVVDNWGGSVIYLNTSASVFIYATPQNPSATYSMEFSTNSAPSFDSGPTLTYGSYGKVSPNDDGTLTFTATDSDAGDQGTDALDWNIRTATGGGGNLVTSGTCTHNTQESVTLTAAMLQSAGVAEDTATTLYLTVSDDDGASVEDTFSVTVIYQHTYTETSGTDLLLIVDTGSHTVNWLEVGGLTTLLAIDIGSDYTQDLEVGGLDTILSIDTGTDQLTFIEIAGTDTVIVIDTGSETESILETEGRDVLLVVETALEILNFLEMSGLDTILSVDSGSDYTGFLEVSGRDVVLVLDTGSDDEQIVETSGSDLLLAIDTGSETLAFVDLSGVDTVLVVEAGTDVIGFLETSGRDVILVSESGTDQFLLLELSGSDVVLVLETGSDTEAAYEVGGSDVVLVIDGGFDGTGLLELTGTDVVLVVESGRDWYPVVVRLPITLSSFSVTTLGSIELSRLNPYRVTITDEGPYAIELFVS